MKNLLWYRDFTEKYMEGLPVGNGRLAAMAVGRPERLRVALNHEWMWRGENRFRDLEDLSHHLPEVREALLAGDYEKGTHLANTYFGGRGGISGMRNRVDPYQPAGDIWVSLENGGAITDYRRQLNMDTASVTVSYTAACGKVEETLFISAADDLGVITVKTEKPAELMVELARIEDPRCTLTRGLEGEMLTMAGQFLEGIAFKVAARIETDGACSFEDGLCRVKGATVLTVLFQIGTNAKGTSPEEEMLFPEKPWDICDMTARHEKAFAKLLGPSSLTVNLPESSLPTDERVEAFRAGHEPTIPLTYFAYGRYLMAAGSSGQLPLNLQGKWNEELEPPWQCDYHLDVNIQMCYWFADILGMHQANNTLFNLCERYVPHAREMAKKLYDCRGICMPIQTDVWGRMTPESCGWSVWIGAAAWLGQHFYRHFEFTGDMDFLKNRAYPFLKEVAAFYEDYLIERDGKLVIVPSQSPENRFTLSGETYPVSICTDSAMDIQMVYEVLTHAITSAKLLGVDKDKIGLWQTMLDKLPALKIGSKGQLVEWNEEFEEVEPGHRHFSNLYGLHPADLFLPGSELEKAAERSMDLRLSHGGGHTGWSRSWTACFMARLGRAEEAWHHLTALIADFATISLLDLHPPRIFQIDGNMGGTAAICEMLMRTLGDDLYLLQALPADWQEGKVEHFCGHGGLDVSFAWKDGTLAEVTLTAPTQRRITVHSAGKDVVISLLPGQTMTTKL